MFSTIGSLVLSACIGFVLASYYKIDDSFLFAITTLLPAFLSAKIIMCFHIMRGQSYFAIQKACAKNKMNPLTEFCLKAFKMQFRNFLLLSAIASLYLFIAHELYFIDQETMAAFGKKTIRNLNAFSLSIVTGLIVAVTHWVIHWEDYFYVSEYQTRTVLKSRNFNEERTEQEISRLRDMGAFGPPEQEK